MNIPYNMFATVSTPDAVKVWDTMSGTVDPPGGPDWGLVDYDDSAWPTGVTPSFTDTTNPHQFATRYTDTGYGPFDTPQAFAPWSTSPARPPTQTFLWRWRITVPDETWFPFQITLTTSFGQEVHVYANNDRSIHPTFALTAAPASPDTPVFTPNTEPVLTGVLSFDSTVTVADMWVAVQIVWYQPASVTGGAVNAWGTPVLGASDKGALGVGDASAHLTPTACAGGLTNVWKVVSNGKTTMFLTTDGTLYACGDNSQGMMGIQSTLTDGTDTLDHSAPELVAPLSWNIGFHELPLIDVSIGQDSVLALDRYGSVWGWGLNAAGSLGDGTTTMRTTPQILDVLHTGLTGRRSRSHAISSGKNFSVTAIYAGPNSIDPKVILATTGDNTYGQLADGTTGSRLTWEAPTVSGQISMSVGDVLSDPDTIDFIVKQISAGDDQLLFLVANNGGTRDLAPYACGRAEFGSLGFDAYSHGTGIHKIVSSPRPLSSPAGGILQLEQAGPLSFLLGNSTIQQVVVQGDGTPYGGAGDDGFDAATLSWRNFPPAIVYGTSSTYPTEALWLDEGDPFDGTNLWPLDGLANSGAGSQNTWSAGNSKAVFAAFGFHPRNPLTFLPGPSDGLLYTWGWGGAGQMGNGSLTETNPAPIAENGLTNVIGACIAEAIMFAISNVGTTTVRRRGRAFAQVIG